MRSWILVDAVRQYLPPRADGVREPAPEYLAGVGPSRSAQLEADLRLTPEERVSEAERTLLNEAGARYVLVGASAMQLWGTTRATRDIDILITSKRTGRLQDAADIEVLEEIKRLRG